MSALAAPASPECWVSIYRVDGAVTWRGNASESARPLDPGSRLTEGAVIQLPPDSRVVLGWRPPGVCDRPGQPEFELLGAIGQPITEWRAVRPEGAGTAGPGLLARLWHALDRRRERQWRPAVTRGTKADRAPIDARYPRFTRLLEPPCELRFRWVDPAPATTSVRLESAPGRELVLPVSCGPEGECTALIPPGRPLPRGAALRWRIEGADGVPWPAGGIPFEIASFAEARTMRTRIAATVSPGDDVTALARALVFADGGFWAEALDLIASLPSTDPAVRALRVAAACATCRPSEAEAPGGGSLCPCAEDAAW